MTFLLLAVIVLIAQIYLASRFGGAIIFEMLAVLCGVAWLFQAQIDPAAGPASALLAGFPAWQVGLGAAALGMTVRLLQCFVNGGDKEIAD
jgi:hypothetical protein